MVIEGHMPCSVSTSPPAPWSWGGRGPTRGRRVSGDPIRIPRRSDLPLSSADSEHLVGACSPPFSFTPWPPWGARRRSLRGGVIRVATVTGTTCRSLLGSLFCCWADVSGQEEVLLAVTGGGPTGGHALRVATGWNDAWLFGRRVS